MNVSPSERKGRLMGIVQLSQHRAPETFTIGDQQIATRVVCKFVVTYRGDRHYLTARSKSRAGAWRSAVRWLKAVQKGKLR